MRPKAEIAPVFGLFAEKPQILEQAQSIFFNG
jgi:hypothetical protein